VSRSPNVSASGIQLDDYNGNVTGTGLLNMFKKLDLLEYMNKSVSQWCNGAVEIC
jgi:hypothetical protein